MAPTVPVEFGGQRESKKWLHIGVSPMMGKSRKVSKGYSHGFVPDYRHAVETMAESEGFGSSGRVDTEMTASEDSCAPKRKCISLNGDSCASFGVPIQFFSLSKMSLPERKDLELRLKSDLEKVRDFQRKIASVSSSVAALSPSVDIHSFSAGQTRPVPETSRPIAAPHPRGKKRAPPGRGGGGRAKKGAAGRPDPLKQALPPASANALIMKQCEMLLNRLMGHSYAWVFNVPVDVVKLKIPDYYTVIKHPMDLGTVKTNLMSGKYTSPGAFAADVRLTFSNATTYNPRGNDVHIMAETLSKFFEMRWKAIEKKLSAITEPVAPVNPSTLLEAEIAAPVPPSKKKKTESLGSEVKQEPIKKVMSDDEKHKLGLELEALLAELPESIIDFLKESSYNGSQVTDDEIEIDIDTLSDETLSKLRKLLDDFLADKQKNLAKAETCEMELHNESGFSNSSVQPCKGKDPVDEDVDIGGNDLPISSFPPVEIEKDPAVRGSKCSSSSSSSSESGSSSSDSDSGSSSGSEADGAEAPVIVNSAKETSGPEIKIEENKDVPDNPDTEYYSANGLIQVEQKSQSNTVSMEVDDRQEGESAPSERQVSPKKRYRAALLKNRFADTILKAQEKAIEKGDKQDPEKLRLEKDELEKRKREEKARLQAEAKAAEEARMNAEAEAAAEAKRRIELEREAARQALQKMEKTVDINENCRFMQDLEMLGVAPTEPLHSFIDKTSPDHSLDRLGSFNFQGISNPLEQLGLYMKKDDDEEEEGEPHSAPATTDDPEEGEID